jgi:hypothetical protein
MAVFKRVVQTPASILNWSPSRISAACLAVATGSATTTATTTLATPVNSSIGYTTQTVITTVATTYVTSVTSTSISKTTGVYAPTSTLNTDGGFEVGGNNEVPVHGWRVNSNNVFTIQYGPAVYDGGNAL